jgi:DNA repair exonuclease SbcCD ATPase subunit
MAEENISLLKSIWRFFTFYKWRKSLAIARAADKQFTGSAAGISDAYDIQHEKMITEFKEFIDAVAAVETAVEGKRLQLENTQKSLEEERAALEGALAVYNDESQSQERRDEAKEDGIKFQESVTRLETLETQLKADIEAQEAEIGKLESQLTAMRAEIAKLPEEKAKAIADFVSNTKLIEAYERLNGLKSRLDRGPLDAVTAANQELAAKARVTGRVVGAATRDKAAEYRNAASKETAGSAFERMAAAKRASKDTATGDGDKTPTTDERPKI